MIFENMDRIVFAGDSVTDMGSTQPIGEGIDEDVGRSYVRVVENMLKAWYPELALRITNSGTSGNTSRDLLQRYQRDVVDLHPQWVSICIGINDIWRQFDCPAFSDWQVFPNEYEANLEKMILSVKDTAKGIILMTPFYMEPNREDRLRKRTDEYVTICKKLAKEHGCILVDLQAMFDRYFTHRHSSYISLDRVHPNQTGATLIAREFLKSCNFDFCHNS